VDSDKDRPNDIHDNRKESANDIHDNSKESANDVHDNSKESANDIHDNRRESGVDRNLKRDIEESVNVPVKPFQSTNLDKFRSEDCGKKERSRNAENIGLVSDIPVGKNKFMSGASVSKSFDEQVIYSNIYIHIYIYIY
jgi:hypothetical protein